MMKRTRWALQLRDGELGLGLARGSCGHGGVDVDNRTYSPRAAARVMFWAAQDALGCL